MNDTVLLCCVVASVLFLYALIVVSCIAYHNKPWEDKDVTRKEMDGQIKELHGRLDFHRRMYDMANLKINMLSNIMGYEFKSEEHSHKTIPAHYKKVSKKKTTEGTAQA